MGRPEAQDWVRKLKLREIEPLAQPHTASGGRAQLSIGGCLFLHLLHPLPGIGIRLWLPWNQPTCPQLLSDGHISNSPKKGEQC